jgi:DNA-binding MarR family transcriptional regulator
MLVMMTNKKTNKLAKWMPKRKYIKLFSLRKGCPLSFNERLVYSLLVYVSRQKKNNALSSRGISRALGIDKDTVPRIVATLLKHGLAERGDAGLIQAKEPTGDRINWFVLNWPDRHQWQDRYSYLLVVLPAPLQAKQGQRRFKLSPGQVAVYCLLVAKEKDGTITTSTASIAGLLGVDVRTVRSALATLEECGLVELHPKGKTILVFRPSEQQLEWFQAKKEQPKKVSPYNPDDDKPWEAMTDEEIHSWVFDPKVNEYGQLLRQIRYYGRYSKSEIEAIRKKADQVRYLAGGQMVARLYHEAEKEHKHSQRQGKFLGTNSYHLLNYKMDKYLEGRDVANLEAG